MLDSQNFNDQYYEYSQEVLLHNIEAEQQLLGALFIKNSAYDLISNILTTDHFYDPLHGRIFGAIKARIETGQVADPITLKNQFIEEPPLGDLTVPQYFGRLAAHATSILNVKSYAETIAKLATRRKIAQVAQEINEAAHNCSDDADPDSILEDAETALFAVASPSRFGSGFMSFRELSTEAVEMAAKAYKNGGGLAGLGTDFVDLDKKMGGLQNSDLIILAGRPSMGKTALATNIAYNVAANLRKNKINGVVGFFSLEMSGEQLTTRMLASYSKLPSEKIRRGDISEDDFRLLTKNVEELKDLPLHIDQTGGITIAQLAARARRLKRQKNLKLLIVDYIQLLSGGKSGSNNRVQEVTEITTGLKALAKELDIPIIALSQLSRQVEQRQDKRPQLSDLRESGSIEQDADVVIFVYREEYYLTRSEPPESDMEAITKWQDAMNRAEGKAEAIISKQRHGPTGIIELQFDGRFTQFSNLQREDDLWAR